MKEFTPEYLENIKNIVGMSSRTYDSDGCWLASPYPSASYDFSVCYVGGGGFISCGSNFDFGVRPVVSLESNIQLTDNGNGVLKID